MNLTNGSIVSFAVDHEWVAEFKNGDDTWSEPVLGWAVVVTWSDYGNSYDAQTETDLMAVVLADNSYPMTIRDYIKSRADGTVLVLIGSTA